jgi:hypothetical protein
VLVPEIGRLDGEVVARDRPDVVLLEVAERNVNRLAREPRQLARACAPDDCPARRPATAR